MKENELGSMVAKELRMRSATVFKLHNDAMQRGLPDYIYWAPGRPIMTFELKIAASLLSCVTSLTPGQESVLRSMALSRTGATVAFGTDRAAGVFTVCGSWMKFIESLSNSMVACDFPAEWSVPTNSKAETSRLIAAMLMGEGPVKHLAYTK